MHKIFVKLMALMAFIKRITPIIDDSADDVTKVLGSVKTRLDTLRIRKEQAKARIRETQERLEEEYSTAQLEIAKSDRIGANLTRILED